MLVVSWQKATTNWHGCSPSPVIHRSVASATRRTIHQAFVMQQQALSSVIHRQPSLIKG
jgi:hypothetical protein